VIKPCLEYLAAYVDALRRDWSPDNVRGLATTRDELAEIDSDPEGFIARQDDPEAKAGPVILFDGTRAPRLPGYRYWIWDGEFCGTIGLRWQAGTPDLPSTCLGHIGYAVVPWKRNNGYAKRALKWILVDAARRGLPYVDLTADPANLASQAVIRANGGELIKRFYKPLSLGGQEACLFRISLPTQLSH
jgi:predicted acetyltransferase